MSELKDVPFLVALGCYWGWTVLFVVGHIRDALANWFWPRGSIAHDDKSDERGYAPLRQDYEDFYTRRVYYRVIECFSRPVYGPPDRVMTVGLREDNDITKVPTDTGKVRKCINLGSYNYLGFASQDVYCTPRCHDTMDSLAVSACATRESGGTSSVHAKLEYAVAQFLHKEDAIVIGMGYATNSTIIPALCGKGDLVVSDALNHSSLVRGIRGSGATVKVFKHNNAAHLDRVLRQAIAYGQPRTHRPWKKILIVVEGVYSMEGEVCDLRGLVEVKKKYGAYLYLDEAHSIGALGTTGRGVCEHLGVCFDDVEILMGTFTKSFGSTGGYIAASRAVIQHLRENSPSHQMATAMSPLAAEQSLAALQLIMGRDGSSRGADKIAQLKFNSNYFRAHLLRLGFHVLGDWDSPIMPIMLYHPGALLNFSKLCLQQHVAVVVVGFPATSLLTARARICISAAHTRTDLDYCLGVLKRVGEVTGCLYRPQVPKKLQAAILDQEAPELVQQHDKIKGFSGTIKAPKVEDATLDVAAVMRGCL